VTNQTTINSKVDRLVSDKFLHNIGQGYSNSSRSKNKVRTRRKLVILLRSTTRNRICSSSKGTTEK